MKYTDIMQDKSRIAGVLLHPTSLPSGKLDKDVFRWLDFIAKTGLKLWQVLPLGVPQENLSPYQCYSAFAINPALLEIKAQNNSLESNEKFQHWYQQEQYWLDDYALFMALRQIFASQAWYQWEAPYRNRNSHALQIFKQQNIKLIESILWQQYQLYTRWQEVHDYAAERGIYLFGDMPIFVAHNSADVWANQECFLLDEDGMPTIVTGVPPDYFSETGQRWGNPHYNWQQMQKNNFNWWLKRLQNHLQLFDVVRIDHFRGLEAVWVIDAKCETAIDGKWQKVAGDKLLQSLQLSIADDKGAIPLVAEDLGVITPEVNALREKYQLPGMSVLQFSFDGFDDNPHKPKNIDHNRIAYTGTHDNDTTEGWLQSLNTDTQQYIMQTLKVDALENITDALIEMTLASKAQLAVIPLQDFLHLGSDARMNIPGTMDNNWQWQFDWQQISDDLVLDIQQKIELAGR
jgi:4-alpha-glucanotransferase